MTLRPNCAAGPLTRMSVPTVTRVPAGSGDIAVVMVAAVPDPRAFRA